MRLLCRHNCGLFPFHKHIFDTCEHITQDASYEYFLQCIGWLWYSAFLFSRVIACGLRNKEAAVAVREEKASRLRNINFAVGCRNQHKCHHLLHLLLTSSVARRRWLSGLTLLLMEIQQKHPHKNRRTVELRACLLELFCSTKLKVWRFTGCFMGGSIPGWRICHCHVAWLTCLLSPQYRLTVN